ncbi:raptor N-terminal caspase like domain-containing protein [Lentinula raphanica]|nr:raptor N-terminal caspase like domain-containing protein [Lentinula raphanica]
MKYDQHHLSHRLGPKFATAPPISYWSAKRHSSCGNPTPAPPWSPKPISWRHTSSLSPKLKIANAALVLCLNIDVDPPDVVKTSPCAVLECGIDPRSMPSSRALERIGLNLKSQFENLNPKIQYKPIGDPTFEDLQEACQQLRTQAKDDAVLFHYNGHGVLNPTSSGELWCFDSKEYTEYIPVSLQDIQNWLGVYIWDCSAAGCLLLSFNEFAKRRDEDIERENGGLFPEGMIPFTQSLQLAACEANETLPTCPDLPADMFTSCLTSPIDIAIRHHILTNKINLDIDGAAHMPGNLKDRRTPLGELNWIFTAITDTIAWTTFSPEIFARLYRGDLLIASLFRNFLLAERLMKGYNCTPHTSPPLPSTSAHPLWDTWDLALDACIRQLPQLLAANDAQQSYDGQKPLSYQYVPSSFFADQMTAFEVWISRGGSTLTRKGPFSTPHLVPRKPPTQLPIILHVLLSLSHRLRALILLSQFVDLGPWAVNLVLTIGIFPYISKFLQFPSPDLKPVLIFIWARILAVDPSIQIDLYNNAQGYKYFSHILAMHPSTSSRDVAHALPNTSEHLAMCTFILASLARDFPKGQVACWEEDVFDACLNLLDEPDFLLMQWSCLCIAQMWCLSDHGKMIGAVRGTQDRLVNMLSNDSAEVRCAALYALSTFMGASGSQLDTEGNRGGGGSGGMYDRDKQAQFQLEVAVVTGATLVAREDASPMCRKELVVLISCLVKEWRGWFVVCAWIYWEERQHATVYPYVGLREESRVMLSSFHTIFVVLLDLSVDPYHEVATQAQTVVDYIMALLLESPFTRLDETSLGCPPLAPSNYMNPTHPDIDSRDARSRTCSGSQQSSPLLTYPTQLIPPPSPSASSIRSDVHLVRPSLSRADTLTSTISNTVSNTVKRTSSIAHALKNLARGITFPAIDDTRTASPTLSVYNHQPTNGASHHLNGDVIDHAEASRPPSPTFNVAQYTSPYSRPITPTQSEGEISPYPPSSSRSPSFREDATQQVQDFRPADVIDALIEEDMERLRARKRSTFFDWCSEYFTEPQMRVIVSVPKTDEPGSVQYNYQTRRQQRNEQVDTETRSQAEVASDRRWDRTVTHFYGPPNPLNLAFHSYDQHLVASNDTDIITVWDWTRKKRLRSFRNGNPKGTSITSLHIINQNVGGIITTGSADGVVRLYRNYDPLLDPGPVQMVSAFRGLSEIVPMRHGAGLVMDWKQSTGILLVGGDSKVIKTWDAQTEIQGLDIDTSSEAPVTSIASDPGPSQMFVAGFGDGWIKVFDRRLEEEEAIVQTHL